MTDTQHDENAPETPENATTGQEEPEAQQEPQDAPEAAESNQTGQEDAGQRNEPQEARGNREAAKYRKQLREVEAERDALQQQLDAARHHIAHAALSAAVIRKAIQVLDDLADELERGLTERDRP